ncbi:hypothetical protein [Arthrobacter globiformis]|uniref:hypothetical protein n=1 Tax=Arthrobacter globiformis TaxID=1665 RepID=UPI0027D7B496|nr:hypothetical protein [Arthrobacter globiformis]
MGEHQLRRLSVIDGHDLVGIVTQADIARNNHEDRVRGARRTHFVLLGAARSITARC